MFDYRKAVLRRASCRFAERLRDSRRHMIAFVAQTVFLLGILYFAPVFGDLVAEARLVAATVASVFLSLFISFIWDLIRAPVDLWTDQTAKLADLERRLRPILSATPANGGLPARWLSGAANRSRFATKARPGFSGEEEYLGLSVHNKTDTELQNCRAYLVALEHEGGESGDFVEAIGLEWLLISDTADTFAQFPPQGVRKLLVARVSNNRPQLWGSHMLPGYDHIFESGGNYTGRIVITASYGGGTLIDFRIVQDGENPRIEVISEPKAIDVDALPSLEMLGDRTR